MATDLQEYYVRRSIQDYFIKFCESSISEEDLRTNLATIDSPIKALTIEVEFRNGSWDICDDEGEIAQSRIGKYIIIHQIL